MSWSSWATSASKLRLSGAVASAAGMASVAPSSSLARGEMADNDQSFKADWSDTAGSLRSAESREGDPSPVRSEQASATGGTVTAAGHGKSGRVLLRKE